MTKAVYRNFNLQEDMDEDSAVHMMQNMMINTRLDDCHVTASSSLADDDGYDYDYSNDNDNDHDAANSYISDLSHEDDFDESIILGQEEEHSNSYNNIGLDLLSPLACNPKKKLNCHGDLGRMLRTRSSVDVSFRSLGSLEEFDHHHLQQAPSKTLTHHDSFCSTVSILDRLDLLVGNNNKKTGTTTSSTATPSAGAATSSIAGGGAATSRTMNMHHPNAYARKKRNQRLSVRHRTFPKSSLGDDVDSPYGMSTHLAAAASSSFSQLDGMFCPQKELARQKSGQFLQRFLDNSSSTTATTTTATPVGAGSRKSMVFPSARMTSSTTTAMSTNTATIATTDTTGHGGISPSSSSSSLLSSPGLDRKQSGLFLQRLINKKQQQQVEDNENQHTSPVIAI